MQLFAVYRQGYWLRVCAGVYSSFGAAKEAADLCAAADYDYYHTYEVRTYALDDKPTIAAERDPDDSSPTIMESSVIYETRKATA